MTAPTLCARSKRSPPSARRGGELSPHLCVAAERIVNRIAQAAIEDMRARYEIGEVAHQIRYNSENRDTSALLRGLARLLNMDASRLRRYARVAESIRATEFAALLGLRGYCGLPLTWSHVELIAQGRTAAGRRQVAEDVLSGMLSVRALRVRMGRAAARDAGGPRPTAG